MARLAAPGLAGFLERGLQDRAARVVLLTLRLYARGLEPLTRDRLTAALRVQPAVPARRALYSASAQLPKWEGLEFLLDECASASEEDLNPLDAALGTWLARINERFSPLNPDMAQILRAALQLARRRFESKHWDRLLALLVEA